LGCAVSISIYFSHGSVNREKAGYNVECSKCEQQWQQMQSWSASRDLVGVSRFRPDVPVQTRLFQKASLTVRAKKEAQRLLNPLNWNHATDGLL
jgi:hypothetical protein